MRQIAIAFCAATLLLACNSESKKTDAAADTKIAGAATDEKAKTEPWVAVDTATANKAWAEYMTPGEAHKMLADANGNWMGDVTMWMESGAPPMKSKTIATNKMILGGRYQESMHKGNMMGMPFEGLSTTAYDNAEKKYISTWIDNMGTGMMKMEGTWDPATKSINFAGKMICPANGKECDVRETYTIVDNNTHLMKMYGPDMKTGKEYQNMEIKFVRSK